MDDNDKIRRNLMVFTISVLYASFVGITISDQKNISLFSEAIKISLPSARVLWIGALVLILYFFARLIQSDEFKRDLIEYKKAFNDFKFDWILTLFEREIRSGNPASFIDTGSIPVSPTSNISLLHISQLIFENRDFVNKVEVTSSHLFPEDTRPISVRILMTFEFAPDTSQSSQKRLIEKTFIDSKENSEFHYKCSPKGEIYTCTIYEYQRNITPKLSTKQMLYANTASFLNSIFKTKYGTLYGIPFAIAATAAPACMVRFIMACLN